MPRPQDISPKKLKRLIAVAAVALVALFTASCLALCSAGSGTESSSAQGSATSKTSDDSSAASASSLTDLDSLGNKAALSFMVQSDQEAFAKALRSWCSSNGIEWPSGAKVESVRNQTSSTAEVYVSFDNGAWCCCVWVSGTANPFAFDSSTEDEAMGETAATESASSLANRQGDSNSEASSGQSSSQEGGRKSQGSSTEQEGASFSTGSSATGSSKAAASSPVKASDTKTLMGYLPQKAAYYLPTVTGNWLASKGISADGGNAVVDASTISQSSVGWSFDGYVKDSSGETHALSWEWNESRQQYGMSMR